MITAFVMIGVDAKLIPEAAQAISELDGVSEVYSVAGGEWDLIAIVRVRHHEQLAEIIPGHLSKVDGVISTTTNIAFRAFSQHDLEAAFSLE
jgi:DNA-binding Lrp family transcriptional regulator